MTSIRFRLFLLLVTTSIGVLSSGYLTWDAFFSYRKSFDAYVLSHEMQEIVSELPSQRFDLKLSKELQSYRERLEPKHRMEALSNVIQSYNDGNKSQLRKRSIFFAKVETEYRKFIRPQVQFLSDRVLYFGGLCIFSTLLAIFLTLIYVQKSVFQPLSGLSRRMIDFLNERYTYQFTAPEPNEVGHLQGTFNALAQRVLSNMEDLKALDQAKSDFLSIASHELRTPLTSIKGSLSLMKSGVVGKVNEAAENLMMIALTETDRLIRLINDLLDLAKIEARRFPLQPRWFPLKKMIESTFSGLEGLALQAQVQLKMDEVPAVEIYMDPDRIQQVLTNLLSNAIKYSPKEHAVTVSIQSNPKGELVVEVTDQGRGIDPEDQVLIFQKFRQATSPKNPLVKGTGLGLAIAKALVEEHSGEIGVRSLPGQGSTFYFTLPQWRFSKAALAESGGDDSQGVAA